MSVRPNQIRTYFDFVIKKLGRDPYKIKNNNLSIATCNE